ncbi:MAG: hypothetical protein QXP38_13100 [Nitrososphaerota archaeon]
MVKLISSNLIVLIVPAGSSVSGTITMNMLENATICFFHGGFYRQHEIWKIEGND